MGIVGGRRMSDLTALAAYIDAANPPTPPRPVSADEIAQIKAYMRRYPAGATGDMVRALLKYIDWLEARLVEVENDGQV